MDPDEFDLRIRVSRMRGQEMACTGKFNYGNELDAGMTVAELTVRYGAIADAYPCGHCAGWHIGPKITDEERYG